MARLGRSQPFKPKFSTPPRIGRYSCTAAVIAGNATSASTCTFDPPVYSGSTTPEVGNATCSISATFGSGTFTASAAPENSGATCSVSATFVQPTFSATAAPANSGATCSVATTFDQPVYSALATVGLYSKLLQDLLCFSGTPTEADFIQFVSDFNDLIDDSSALSDPDLAFLDMDTQDGVLTYADRDFWIEMIAQKYLTLTGRTFGSATPSTLALADPLGLRLDTAGSLRTDVIIIDPDAANETTSDADGPVKIIIDTNTCLTPGGLTKNAGGSSNLWSTTGEAYRYQLWTRFADLNEYFGTSIVRLKDGPTGTVENQEVTVYIRYGSHTPVNEEIILGKRAAGVHAGKIIIRGYPCDKMPIIRMGNSCVDADGVTLDDVSPATVGDINGSSARPAMVTVGNSSTRERYNVFFKYLDVIGNRDLIGASGKSFASKVFSYTGFSSGGIIGCKISGWQYISPDDPNAAIKPDLVDTHFNLRDVNTLFCLGIDIRCSNFELRRSHIEGLDPDADWINATNSAVATILTSQSNAGKLQYTTSAAHGLAPGDIISISGHTGYTGFEKNGKFTVVTVDDATNFSMGASSFTGTGGTGGSVRILPLALSGVQYGGINVGTPSSPGLGNGLTIRQNKFSGVILETAIRARAVDNIYIGYNDLSSYDGSIVLFSDVDNFTIEYNRVHHFAQLEYNVNEGEHGCQLSIVSNGLVQGNVIYNPQPTDNSSGFGIWQKRTSHNVLYRQNILYRAGYYVDMDEPSATNLSRIEFSRNLVSGFDEDLKTTYVATINAPLLVNMRTTLWTDGVVSSSASTGGGTPKVIFTVTPGHSIEVGDVFTVTEHSISGYNTSHTVTAVNGLTNQITTSVAYTSSGTGGYWRFTGASAAKSSGQDGTLNGVVRIIENAIWRFEDSTPDQATIEAGPHLSVRDGSSSDFFEVDDTLDGFEDNVAERPEWLNDPETGDFRLDGTNTYADWFLSDTPFLETLQWDANPLDDFCALSLGLAGDVIATFDPPVYTAIVAQVLNGADSASTCEFDPPVYTGTCAVTTGETTSDSDCVFASAVFSASSAITLNNAEMAALAEFDSPVYTGSSALVINNAECSVSASFSNNEYNATIAVTLSPVTHVSQCVFSVTGTFVATCAVVLDPVACTLTATHDTSVLAPTIYAALFSSFDISI